MASEMSIAGARMEKGDVDMAWNMSKRKGSQMLTKHWALEETSDCTGLSDLSAGEGGLEHRGELLTLENKLQPCVREWEGPELRRVLKFFWRY